LTKVVHLTHSTDLRTGGVIEAVLRLDESLKNLGVESLVSDDPKELNKNPMHCIAHGLWQWPSVAAWKNFRSMGAPYLIFPHGMLDPWFKHTFPFKHLKKQAYWWLKQGRILREAKAVCFTTEEERRLAQRTFWPYRCREVVTGLGVTDPPFDAERQIDQFLHKFPQLRGKKTLLYLGRMHPKKGLDLLIRSFLREKRDGELLVLAGPLEPVDRYMKNLQQETKGHEDKIVWTGMLEGDLKWGALRSANALILPSHQENYGMVVAEALSVGTPVFLTDKVNLCREVVDAGAGFVAKDDQAGIDQLLAGWRMDKHAGIKEACLSCFGKRLHIRNCSQKIMDLLIEPSGTG
jgi:glycosyltransferase involved in cell wall biosynthesis